MFQGLVVAGCELLSGRLRRGDFVRVMRQQGQLVKEVSLFFFRCFVIQKQLIAAAAAAVASLCCFSLQALRVVSLRVGKESREAVVFPAECGVVCGGFNDWQLGDSLVVEDKEEETNLAS